MKPTLIASFILCISALLSPTFAQANNAAADAIRKPALDYINGWYDADPARMEAALHPDLAKRRIAHEPGSSRITFQHMSAMTLVQYTRNKKPAPKEGRIADITVLDVFGDIATLKVVSSTFVDYLHVARWNGEWKIVNVLWDMKPAK